MIFTKEELAEKEEWLNRLMSASIRTNNSVEEDYRARIEMLELEMGELKKIVQFQDKMLEAIGAQLDAMTKIIDILTPKHLKEGAE